MQEELAFQKRTNDRNNKSVDFQAAPKNDSKSADKDNASAAASKKMIAELAAEVKRLTALLPRRLINASEEQLLEDSKDNAAKNVPKVFSDQVVQTEVVGKAASSSIRLVFFFFMLGGACAIALLIMVEPPLIQKLAAYFSKVKS